MGPPQGPPEGGPPQGPPEGGPPTQGDAQQGPPTIDDHINRIFNKCDGNDDNKITWKEARACGAPKKFKAEFLKAAGTDKAVDRAELKAFFRAVMAPPKGDAQQGPPSVSAIVNHIFKQCDEDTNGKITWAEASACGAPADFKPDFLKAAGTDKAVNRAELTAAL